MMWTFEGRCPRQPLKLKVVWFRSITLYRASQCSGLSTLSTSMISLSLSDEKIGLGGDSVVFGPQPMGSVSPHAAFDASGEKGFCSGQASRLGSNTASKLA